MSLLVRTWNVFHGRTFPEAGRLELERMVRMATSDGPDLVALQEVPVWALGHLARWSGMKAVGATTMPAFGGPLARRLTELDPRRLRSLLTGQANALLVGSRLELVGRPVTLRLNPRGLRHVESRRRRLRRGDRFAWAWNRRLCQALHVQDEDGSLIVASLHASKDPELAAVELARLPEVLDTGRAILCGDFNARGVCLPAFSAPIDGIDQILVRDLTFEAEPARWERDRRSLDGLLLSDHAPVEAVIA